MKYQLILYLNISIKLKIADKPYKFSVFNHIGLYLILYHLTSFCITHTAHIKYCGDTSLILALYLLDSMAVQLLMSR